VGEVRARLARWNEEGHRPKSLAFVHGGEPTLDARLGVEIDRLSAENLTVVVMTNASLLWRPEVRSRLMGADRVVVKLDTVDPATWRRLNRPARQLRLSRVLTGLEIFRGQFPGRLDTRTTLVPGLNDSPAQLEALAGTLQALAPRRVHLTVKGGGASLAETAPLDTLLERISLIGEIDPRLVTVGPCSHGRKEAGQ
jgi:wyosine [tRNA(Phe)-imidazoG37] synthetase (radical SAM superfamily)